MISFTSSGPRVSVSGLSVYLDNWAIGDLAEGDPSRRRRFIDALCTGEADLVFSVANAAELTGAQGESRDSVKAFLDEIRLHWFPMELNVKEVLDREARGADPGKSCVAEEFFAGYLAHRMKEYTPGAGRVIDPSEVFRLGAMLDWLGPQRETIRKTSATLGDSLGNMICRYRAESERNPKWLDQTFPVTQFNRLPPATFTYVNLVRALIETKADRLKGNDGLDFCHAVMGTAFSSFATLDKNWKRRVESLPPHRLAFVYNPLELDAMVTDIDLTLKRRAARR